VSDAPPLKRQRRERTGPRRYLSTDPFITEHPLIRPQLAYLKTLSPPPTRPTWNLPADVWRTYLHDYPDDKGGQAYVREVLRRNLEGWPTTSTQEWQFMGDCEEYAATLEEHVSGLKKIIRRVKAHYLWGPFPSLDATPFEESMLAVWPHFFKAEIDKLRMLVNMSSTERGPSLNAQIADPDKYVRYITVLTIVRRIVVCRLKRLWAVDAFEAYCRVPLEGRMIPLLGVKMCGLYFFYTCLVMGYSPSSRVYTEFGDVVQWICTHRKTTLYEMLIDGTLHGLILHYLDGSSLIPSCFLFSFMFFVVRLLRRSRGLSAGQAAVWSAVAHLA
jgi:hypothetical protein